MTDARFYPTLTTLPAGRVLATAGRDDGGMAEPVLTFEIFDPGQDPPVWEDVVNVPTDGIGTEYPHMFVVPDTDPNVHKVFFSSSYFPADIVGEETTYMLDVGAETWTPVGGDPPFHASRGSAVMYEPGIVLKCGGKDIVGGQGILAETATINLNDSMPAWQSELPMVHARRDPNLVLLPHGKILAVGGIDPAAVLVAEWFDPNDPLIPQWEELDAMTFERGDHSIAMLLADGRVLSAGGHTDSAEIFSPPYLFKAGGLPADRPEVGFAPTAVAYGTSFSVVLSSASPVSRNEIAKVTLLRLGAGTHSFDMDQRYMSLPVQTDPARPNALIVEAPENGTFAPPGYYMLFLISVDDAPSIAKYVRLFEAPTP